MMKKTRNILIMSMLLTSLVTMAVFASGTKLLTVEVESYSSQGTKGSLAITNAQGKIAGLEGTKLTLLSEEDEDGDYSHDVWINATAVVKGETTLTVELTDDTYYEAMVYPIIKKLDSTTVVVGDVLEPQTHNIGMFEGPYTDPEDVAIRLTDKGEYLVELFVANAGEGNSAYGYIRIEDDKGPEQPAPQPAPQPGQLVAKPTASKVLVDQKPVDFEAYTIENSNYIKLRDFAYAVNQSKKQFQVSWDSEKSAINLISNTPYSPSGSELKKGKGQVKTPVINQSKIYKDQKEINLKAYTIDGNNYFKLRDLAKEFDIAVTWDGATSTIGIDTSL